MLNRASSSLVSLRSWKDGLPVFRFLRWNGDYENRFGARNAMLYFQPLMRSNASRAATTGMSKPKRPSKSLLPSAATLSMMESQLWAAELGRFFA